MKFHRQICFLAALLLCPLMATAQLAVTVMSPKVTGQMAVVQLKMKNNLGRTVQSARAVCFLLDSQGKMVGQSMKWVIGQNKTELEPGATNSFNFVITSSQPLRATNLTAKITFSRVVLDGGHLADVTRDVMVSQ